MTAIMEPNLMPGSFLPDNDFSFRCARFKASPFQPPHDDVTTPNPPSAWSQHPHRQPVRAPTSTLNAPQTSRNKPQHSRKRLRLDTRSVPSDSYNGSRSSHSEALSPPPFVNTNYRFAGGLDNRTALHAQEEEDAHEFDYEIDCRPSRYDSQNSRHTSDSYFPQTPAPDENGRNKRRFSPASPPMKSWGKTVWALTGGFAGKVFNFCWNTTFNGFYAGGGSGYRFDIGTPGVAFSTAWTEVDAKDDVFHNDYHGSSRRGDREHTPVPGGFPEDGPEFIEDYMSKLTVNTQHNNLSTPIQKFQDESSSLTRFNGWVVVDGQGTTPASREASPARKKSRASTANLYAARPSPPPRHSTHALSRPRLTPRSSTVRSSASYASPRTSLSSNLPSQHRPRTSTSSIPTTDSRQHQSRPENSASHSPSSKHPHSNRASRCSLTSPRRQSSISQTNSTPKPSPEVRKFEQKLRKKEARQDESMNRFNDRLQAMIREGQAALGSRVEVEMGHDEDEGYFEDGFGVGKGVSGEERWERARPGLWS